MTQPTERPPEVPQHVASASGPHGAVSRAIAWIGRFFALLFLISVVVILYEIVMRYVFDAPTIWAHETTTALSALCFAFGGAYALAIDKHIRVVLIYDKVGPHGRRRLDIAISLIGMVASALLAYAAFTITQKALFMPGGAFRLERSGSAWNPPFPALLKTFLLAVLILMTVQFALLLWHHLRRPPTAPHAHDMARDGYYEDV